MLDSGTDPMTRFVGLLTVIISEDTDWTVLHFAAYLGNVPLVTLLLARSPSLPHALSRQGLSPLHCAAMHLGASCGEIIEKLLQAGCPLDCCDQRGFSPLYIATRLSSLPALSALLPPPPSDVTAAAASTAATATAVERLYPGNCSLLHVAARWGSSAVLSLLLTHPASSPPRLSPTALNRSNASPLHCAARGGDAQCLSLLLTAGADANGTDKASRTPLHIASRYGHESAVRCLLQRGDVDVEARDQSHCTALQLACRRGHTAVALLLLRASASQRASDHKSDQSLPPLHLAVLGQHRDTALLLLRFGAPVHQLDRRGRDALQLACFHCLPAMVQLLLTAGFDANGADDSAFPPLHYLACRARTRHRRRSQHSGCGNSSSNGETDSCSNSGDGDGNGDGDGSGSDSHSGSDSADSPQCKVLRLLLAAGAAVGVTSFAPIPSPLHLAAKAGNIELLRALLQLTAPSATTTEAGTATVAVAAVAAGAATVDTRRRRRLWLRRYVDVDCTDKDGCTPLHYAAHFRSLPSLQALLAAGASPHLLSSHGATALHLAAAAACPPAVRLLLAAGASATAGASGSAVARDTSYLIWGRAAPLHNHTYTALHYAVVGGSVEVARLLIEAGADVNAGAKAISGTPLHFAARFDRIHIMRLLLRCGAHANPSCHESITSRYSLISRCYLRSPLFFAAVQGCVPTVSLLLRHGADTDNPIWVHSPLDGCCRPPEKRLVPYPSFAIPAAAAAAAAAATSSSSAGFWRVQYRQQQPQHPCRPSLPPFRPFRQLIAWGVHTQQWSSRDPLAVARLLLRANANPNGSQQRTPPLVSAVRSNHAPLLSLLLAAGANVNARAVVGNKTALHAVTEHTQRSIWVQLLMAGADTAARDRLGTPASAHLPPILPPSLQSLLRCGWSRHGHALLPAPARATVRCVLLLGLARLFRATRRARIASTAQPQQPELQGQQQQQQWPESLPRDVWLSALRWASAGWWIELPLLTQHSNAAESSAQQAELGESEGGTDVNLM